MNKFNDVKNILETIPLCEDTFELGTLYGCKSAVYSYYWYEGIEKSKEYGLKAIKLNPQCGMWHYLHANSLRLNRRSVNINKKPTVEERKGFETAFELQAKPFFGLYLSQMYRESFENDKAKEMYNTIFAMPNINSFIYMKLALGFLSFKDYEKARICLDYVEARFPEDVTFIHYKGLYLEKCLKDTQGALQCFEKAGALNNFAADICYMSLQMRITGGRYNPMLYLTSMLERYREFGGYRVQVIYIHMGQFYDLSRGDAKNACKYYLQAIEIDLKSETLQKFYSHISERKFSVFAALQRHILPKLSG